MSTTTGQTIELNTRGLVCACLQCGQRNRLLYERLGHLSKYFDKSVKEFR